MFTGIISDIGTIISRNDAKDTRIQIATNYDTNDIKLGESIACNGVCLTVIEKKPGSFSADISAETLHVTAPDYWLMGAKLNLERALKMGDDLSGHMVTGHVDGLAKILEIIAIGDSYQITLQAPTPLHRFIATKGSVTLNGVSLTVNQIIGQVFTINIIPHTWQHTNFKFMTSGSVLNIEIDVIARYMARLLETAS